MLIIIFGTSKQTKKKPTFFFFRKIGIQNSSHKPFSINRHIMTILGFSGTMVFVAAAQPSCCSGKVARDSTEVNDMGSYVSIKLYL